MLFGLKNAGHSYQRFVNEMFKHKTGKDVEVYVDDMIVKSKKQDHTLDLRDTLSTLRAHNMKVNPKKCVLVIWGEKCLGYLVDKRGIENW